MTTMMANAKVKWKERLLGSYSTIWSIPLTNVKWHSDPWPTVTSQPIRLSTNFMTLIPSLTSTDYEWFPWSICNGCGMPAGNAYPSGHLVPSPFWDLLMLQLLRPNSSNLPCLYSTFHLEYPLVLSRFCLKGFLKIECNEREIKAKQNYRGMFKTQKSGNNTSSGEIGLNIKKLSSPKVGHD